MYLNNKRGGIIAIWIFVVMVVVTCLTATFFFIQSSQGSSKSFQAVSSGFYFHMEKERTAVMLSVYADEAIFKTYRDFMNTLSTTDVIVGCVPEKTKFILGDSYLAGGKENDKLFAESVKNNLQIAFSSYPEDLNGDKLKAALKNAVVGLDGDKLSIKISNYKINYSAEGIDSNYTFDVFYNVSLSDLGLISLKNISLVKEKCIKTDRSYDTICIQDYFKDYDVHLYLGITCQNYLAVVLDSKKQYFFDNKADNIRIGFVFSQENMQVNSGDLPLYNVNKNLIPFLAGQV